MLNNKKGFTLIELLVVIAIIGMLAATVLTSLGTARAKGRDARRISDMQSIALALELYADSNKGNYPATLSGLVSAYLPSVPTDPSTGSAYLYYVGGRTAAGTCNRYHLGAVTEVASTGGSNSPVLPACKLGAVAQPVDTIVGGANGCAGTAVTAGTADTCYDVAN